jgi:hypothetical protein
MADMSTTMLPGPFAAPPVPCNTQILITWLNANHGFAIPADAPFHRKPSGDVAGVVGCIQARYGAIPMRDGETLWPSDAWAHVVACERRIRGGQQSLFAEEMEAAS